MDIIYLQGENFDSLLSNKTVLVDFYADWCGPCKMMNPILESIKENIQIIKVNVDQYQTLAKKYNVMSIPTLIFFKEGDEITRTVGFKSAEDLSDIIDKL